MYLQQTSRKNKDGSVVRYLQLVHNVWDSDAGCAKAQVIYNFGRAEQVDVDALRRLVQSISRFLSLEDALRTQAELRGEEADGLRFMESRPLGGAWLLAQLSVPGGAGAVCFGGQLVAHPVYGRYLKTDSKGRLKVNEAKIREDEHLDGKYLLRTSDDTLSAEDAALGYKQLYEVEDTFRALKQTLDLRPVYHRFEDRIRAHVLLCWLGLLLIRVAETKTGHQLRHLRASLQRMHLGRFAGSHGVVEQRTETTAGQKQILQVLKIDEPPRFIQMAASSIDEGS